jgi:hypothetical protein
MLRRTLPSSGTSTAKSRGEHISARGFALAPTEKRMRRTVPSETENFEPNHTKPAWACVWHMWTLILPRRAIDAGFVWGRVWRRHDGRRWLYKRFIEFDDRG